MTLNHTLPYLHQSKYTSSILNRPHQKKKTKAKKCLSTPPPIPQVIPLLNLFSFQFLESSIYLATPPTCPNVSLHQFVFFFLSGEESAKHQL